MTRNVTLRMNEDLLVQLRHNAVDAKMSLSAWITATLENIVSSPTELDKVRASAIRRMERGFHLGNKATSREELHAR
jgi:hypothetical protein